MPRYTVYRNPERDGYLLDLQADINSHFSMDERRAEIVAALDLLFQGF